jgi:hypothetical protein
MGIVIFFGMEYKTDFTQISDFILFPVIMGVPLSLILVPVFLEYFERKRDT